MTQLGLFGDPPPPAHAPAPLPFALALEQVKAERAAAAPVPREALVEREPMAASRAPGRGEHPCDNCGAAACYFYLPHTGLYAEQASARRWCRACAPPEYRPGAA